jgi:hypothetical protein
MPIRDEATAMRSLSSGSLGSERGLPPALYGWKAANLAVISAYGLPVPPGLALAHGEWMAADDLFAAVSLEVGSHHGEVHVAVRSSGLTEDSGTASQAGSFLTIMGRFEPAALASAVEQVRASGEAGARLGVLIQRLVPADFSGVALSMDPVTYSRDVHVVAWVPGAGESLVGGNLAGELVVVSRDTHTLQEGHWPHSQQTLRQLADAVSLLQDIFACPVDVEWCIERSTGKLQLVQVRPIVLPNGLQVQLDSLESFKELPAIVMDHPKIRLRQLALEFGIPMSSASVLVWSGTEPSPPDARGGEPTSDAAGNSVVLLHPSHVHDKVVREFAPVCGLDVEFFTEGCRRYAIRRYPASENADAALREVAQRGLDRAWLSVTLRQEILAPEATGIIRLIDDAYVIEMAMGHFVPKGYVETSTFLVSHSFDSCVTWRVPQEKVFHFINGHVVVEEPPEEQLSISDDQAIEIALQLSTLLQEVPHLALEFGVLRKGPGISAYLIDAAESDSNDRPIVGDWIKGGVLSIGMAEGAIVDLSEESSREHLNAHLLERHAVTNRADGVVYLAERATVDLLPLAYSAGSGTGFVFAQASMLAHLAVVLRELGVPAVVVGSERLSELARATQLRFDARADGTVQLTRGER